MHTATIYAEFQNRNTRLNNLIRAGNTEEALKLISEMNSNQLRCEDKSQRLPIEVAFEEKNYKILKALISKGPELRYDLQCLQKNRHYMNQHTQALPAEDDYSASQSSMCL